jgi:hypothetical protein
VRARPPHPARKTSTGLAEGVWNSYALCQHPQQMSRLKHPSPMLRRKTLLRRPPLQHHYQSAERGFQQENLNRQ